MIRKRRVSYNIFSQTFMNFGPQTAKSMTCILQASVYSALCLFASLCTLRSPTKVCQTVWANQASKIPQNSGSSPILGLKYQNFLASLAPFRDGGIWPVPTIIGLPSDVAMGDLTWLMFSFSSLIFLTMTYAA